MGELDFDREYLLHVRDEDLGERLYRALFSACGQEEAIRSRIRTQTGDYKQKLGEMGIFLRDFLRDSRAFPSGIT